MEITKGDWKRFVGIYKRQDLHEVVVTGDSEVVAYTDTEANAYLIARSPRMAGFIKKIVKQDGWLNQEDLVEAKAIIQNLTEG